MGLCDLLHGIWLAGRGELGHRSSAAASPTRPTSTRVNKHSTLTTRS